MSVRAGDRRLDVQGECTGKEDSKGQGQPPRGGHVLHTERDSPSPEEETVREA